MGSFRWQSTSSCGPPGIMTCHLHMHKPSCPPLPKGTPGIPELVRAGDPGYEALLQQQREEQLRRQQEEHYKQQARLLQEQMAAAEHAKQRGEL